MAKLTPQRLEKMRIGRENAKLHPKSSTPTPIVAIRRKCLDCSGTVKMVKYCPLDGINSTKCDLWPYRFGMRPETAITKHGAMFLKPKEMPSANTNIEDLP